MSELRWLASCFWQKVRISKHIYC